jgi:hypothetical protein
LRNAGQADQTFDPQPHRDRGFTDLGAVGPYAVELKKQAQNCAHLYIGIVNVEADNEAYSTCAVFAIAALQAAHAYLDTRRTASILLQGLIASVVAVAGRLY